MLIILLRAVLADAFFVQFFYVAEFLPWSSPFLLFRQESAHRPADYITLFGFGRNTYGSAVAFNHFTAAKLTSAARFHLALIIGASGAGKTTVLNILGGMDTATSGAVYIDGEDISKWIRLNINSLHFTVLYIFYVYNTW
jgi:ABC-type multidrug transport system fused ATPase/permease subunit